MEIFAAIAFPIFILMFTFGTRYAARRRAVAARVLSLFIPILRGTLVDCAASLNCPSTIALFSSISSVRCNGDSHVCNDQTWDLQTRMNLQASVPPKLRILIIDDDDVLRRWLRSQLEHRGCEVWEESQGDEALARYRRSGPWDFVLSHFYFYPGEEIRNGLELMREILLINPQQRSVIHTSERKITAPCIVLQKPYPISALLKLLPLPLSPIKVDE